MGQGKHRDLGVKVPVTDDWCFMLRPENDLGLYQGRWMDINASKI